MATQFTPILQLALPVTGELNGTWGDVVNDNITSMVEQAIAGLSTISTWTANSHTLTTADGTTDEARCAMLVAATGAGGTALTAAGEIICPARTKLFVLKNGSAYAVTLKTAAGAGVAVAAGDTAFLFCDGTNVGACVTTIVNGHITGNLTVDGNTTLGNATSDTITATARIASDLNPSADNTYDLGTLGNSWRNLYIDGTATIASLVATTADINGGTIDATSIGATTPSTGVFTQVDITAQGDLRLQDTTGGQYVALQAPGTVPASYTLTMPDTDGDAGQSLVTDGFGVMSWSTAASGDVYGPDSATDNAIARFDGTTGKLIQNSVFTIADDGASVLSVNSASDGLRITQIGAGNALVVEDSANPDATPFVINSSGEVIIGNDTALAYSSGLIPQFQVNKASAEQMGISRFSADNGSNAFLFLKSRGATINSYDVVASGDGLGSLIWLGTDGTAGIQAATIQAAVDGTPGANDMPGRLVFSTTRDGASSPTEAMRIDSAGQVGIGATSLAGINLRLSKNITGNTNTQAIRNDGIVQSDSTTSSAGYYSQIGTAAAAFTLSNLYHQRILQGTFGAGSAVTNQYGFYSDASLTGATNNYGFYSNIASGTGRYNFYAAGSADNYFAGATTISVSTTSDALRITQTGAGNALVVEDSANPDSSPFVVNSGGTLITGHTSSVGTVNTSQIQSITTAGNAFSAQRFSSNSSGPEFNFAKSKSDTVGTNTLVGNGETLGMISFVGADGTSYLRGAWILGEVDGTPGTNDMPGRLVFATTADGASSPTERMRIDSAGAVQVRNSSATYYPRLQIYDISGAANQIQGALDFYSADGSAPAGAAVRASIDIYANINGGLSDLRFLTNDGTLTERMRIDSAGRVGIGATPSGGNTLTISRNITGATTASGTLSNGSFQSDVTGLARVFTAQTNTANANFVISDLFGYQALQGTLSNVSAGGSVTRQYGFFTDSGITGATNNYGFYSNIAAGTGRYTFYAAGTAQNYFAGVTTIGTATAGTGTIVDVQSTTAGVRFPNMTTAQKTAITPAAGTVVFDTTLAKLCVYSGAAWQTITSI